MARVIHVKSAQQRYETVPVIDPETGEPKRTPVIKRDGTQKTTKSGQKVFMTVTRQDKNKPKPPYKCDYSGCPYPDKVIEIGTPYKHMTPKTGQRSGRKLTRHANCPDWKIWEYSNSWAARIEQATSEFDSSTMSSEDDVTSVLESISGNIEALAEESSTAASNIEEGFGWPTSQSEEAAERAESLENWAQEISAIDVPDMVECPDCSEGKVDCPDCEGGGYQRDEDGEDIEDQPCGTCGGDGQVDCDTCDGSGEDIEEWRSAVDEACSIVFESPV